MGTKTSMVNAEVGEMFAELETEEVGFGEDKRRCRHMKYSLYL